MSPTVPPDLSGLCFVGRFQRVDESRPGYPALVIEYDIESAGGARTGNRKISFTGFSPADGSPTQIGKVLAGLSAGEPVAVRVWAEVRPAGVGRDGQAYEAFVTLSAMGLHRLSEATPAHASRGGNVEAK